MFPKLTALIAILAWAAPAFAQVTCRSEISYQWKKHQEENLIKVATGGVQAEGADEAQAKARLAELLPAEQGKAQAICRAEHENLSGCISSKTAAASAVLQSMGFAARKALEESIASDCKSVAGGCKEAVASEPVCAAKEAKAEGGGEAAAGAKGDSKEAKGAKKK